MNINSIAVLGHNYALSPLNHRFVMSYFCKYWKEKGIDVKVVLGTENDVDADVIINHVDLTITPDDYIKYMDKFRYKVNFNVRNISKKIYSNNRLSMDDTYAGKVILKTDANCGGYTDYYVNQSEKQGKPVSGKALRRRKSAWHLRSFMNSFNYRIFDNIDDVPVAVWTNENLIVEKFIPEHVENDLYQVRYWYFFGDKEINIGVQSDYPIVKGPKITKRYIIDHIPDELREYRSRYKFDYGRFDYSIVDGKVNIFDMNRTPTIGESMIKLFSDRFPSELADGINSLV